VDGQRLRRWRINWRRLRDRRGVVNVVGHVRSHRLNCAIRGGFYRARWRGYGYNVGWDHRQSRRALRLDAINYCLGGRNLVRDDLIGCRRDPGHLVHHNVDDFGHSHEWLNRLYRGRHIDRRWRR
jgi:hypothetical protein